MDHAADNQGNGCDDEKNVNNKNKHKHFEPIRFNQTERSDQSVPRGMVFINDQRDGENSKHIYKNRHNTAENI